MSTFSVVFLGDGGAKMIIIKENKKNLTEDSVRKILLQDFIKLVGVKTECRAAWISKSGIVEVSAEPPAFCGFRNGFFHLATPREGLSVSFQARFILTVRVLEYDDGESDYGIYLNDGTKINLRF